MIMEAATGSFHAVSGWTWLILVPLAIFIFSMVTPTKRASVRQSDFAFYGLMLAAVFASAYYYLENYY